MKRSVCFLLAVSLLFFSIGFIGCAVDGESVIEKTYITPVWKGSRSYAPWNPEIGWAYYNLYEKKSYIYDGSSWQILAQDGADGKDGANGKNGKDGLDGISIIWKGELAESPAFPEANWAYYNLIDGNSYIYDGENWNYLAKSGRNGATGILLWLGSLDYPPSSDSVSEGYAYYNTTDKKSYVYNGYEWEVIAQDGLGIEWQGVLPFPPENPKVNWAYYDTTTQSSFIYTGSSWDLFAASGDATIYVSISWQGTFDSAPENPEIGWAYYNSSTGCSYIYDGTVWNIIAKDGEDGKDGADGSSGGSSGESGGNVAGYLITWKGSHASAPTNPKSGWAYYNSSEKKSYIYDGSSWQILAQDGKDGADGSSGGAGSGGMTGSGDAIGYVHIGSSTETIDGITYNVESYADVYTQSEYFYNYYKFYYLNGILRRTYMGYHSVGSCLDYKYNEFVEHNCGNNTLLSFVYEYYENGIVAKTIQITGNTNDSTTYKYITNFSNNGVKLSYIGYKGNDNIPFFLYKYYETGKINTQISYNADGTISSKFFYSYYPNGNKKTEDRYLTGDILNYSYTYYENGMEESHTYYNANGNISSKETYTYHPNGNKATEHKYGRNEVISAIYTYYENGNRKTYEDYNNGVVSSYTTYFDDGSSNETYIGYNTNGSIYSEAAYYSPNVKKYSINFNTDGTINNFDYHYTSGYTQYYYTDSGYLYTYEDGKTTGTSTSASDYKSKDMYTLEQAKALWESLTK